MRPFDVLPRFPLPISERMGNYYLEIWHIRGSSGVQKQLKVDPLCNIWSLTFVNKLKFTLILQSFFLKHQKTDNRSWDIYVVSHTETCFYTFSK